MSWIRKFIANESGNSMVEFALVTAVFFIPLVFGAIEFGRLTWSKDMILAAAREGVRYAAVHGTENEQEGGTLADSAAVADTVKSRTKLGPLSVVTVWNNDKTPGDTVTVTVTYVYTPIMKIPGLTAAKTITGRSRQIIMH